MSNSYIGSNTTASAGTSAFEANLAAALEAKAEISLAEQKVAWGIKYLYQMAQERDGFDGQNIATIPLERADLNLEVDSPFGRCRLGDLFPNGLQNGVTIHLFDERYIRHPAAFYMLQQKIRSLCQAAARSPYNLHGTDAISRKIEADIRSELEGITQAIYDRDSENQDSKNQDSENQDTQFHQAVDKLIQKYSLVTAKALHTKYQTESPYNRLGVTAFGKKLLENSCHYRSDTHDILTFNLEKKRFSYDEAAKVTAHDRTLGSGCANLSLMFEGRYKMPAEEDALIQTEVTTSGVKHASPVAIDSIALLGTDKTITDTALLVDTYRNLQDVITAMVRLRTHGRSPSHRHDPMHIDWVYQILTTNAFNLDYQAAAYGYSTRAARLLNQGQINIAGTPVSLQIGIMNAGINKIADVGQLTFLPTFVRNYISKYVKKMFAKADIQRRENRHAYLQLTNAVSHITFNPEALSENKYNQALLSQTVQHLKDVLSPVSAVNAEVGSAKAQLEAIKKNIANNSNRLATLISQLQPLENRKIELAHQINELKNNETPDTPSKRNVLLELQNEINTIETSAPYIELTKKIDECDDRAATNYDNMVRISNVIENAQREQWRVNCVDARCDIRQLHKYFNANKAEILERLQNPGTAEATTQQILALTALVYKTYADELYYGDGTAKYAEVYRNPEKAALFNAYLISFQHLVGMMASFGCKSANDRTLVMRILVAAFAGIPLDKQTLPNPYHDTTSLAPPKEQATDKVPLTEKPNPESILREELNKELSSIVMTNAALFSCINDTSGGTAKVDPSKFPIFGGVLNLHYIGHFGEKYAAHKMAEKGISEPKSSTPAPVRTTSVASTSGSRDALFAQSSHGIAAQQETSKSKKSPDSHTPPRSPLSKK